MAVRRTVEMRKMVFAQKIKKKKQIASERGTGAYNYRERNRILNSMGFSSYAEYLKSDLWKSISKACKDRSPQCECCRHMKATEAHHRKYTLESLTTCNHDLVSLCEQCHESIEFKKNGEKKFAGKPWQPKPEHPRVKPKWMKKKKSSHPLVPPPRTVKSNGVGGLSQFINRDFEVG